MYVMCHPHSFPRDLELDRVVGAIEQVRKFICEFRDSAIAFELVTDWNHARAQHPPRVAAPVAAPANGDAEQ